MQPHYGAERQPSSGKGSRQHSPEGRAASTSTARCSGPHTLGHGDEGGSGHRGKRDETGASPGVEGIHASEGPGDVTGDNGRSQERRLPGFRCGTRPEGIETSETRNNTLDSGAGTRPGPVGGPAAPDSRVSGYARGNVREGSEWDDNDDDEVPSPPDDDPALTGPLGLRNDAEADDVFLRGVMEKLAGMERGRGEDSKRRGSGSEGGDE
ncbi:uncharacterized protein DNG_06455 [Cephalotrichum gorgonifer]|uniref:Uncharacterized protein n=1 Tax=Cephalotrichum gorgonifer TaxID=2041049 RepID=A0AAE8N058_9PEZI|nr:uncharacterized protein DNG_06455 [Cephalotrichum gorgonifer]